MSGGCRLLLKSIFSTTTLLSMLSRLAYWLGKLLDASQKFKNMVPSEHFVTTFRFDVMCLGMYFLYCFEHFFEVNSKLIMHLLR